MKFLLKKLFIFSAAIVAVLSVALTSSCVTVTNDIYVETHTESGFNPSAYKTYAWAGSAQIIFDPVGQWEKPTLDTDEEVRFVVNRELRNLGINQTTQHPDLLVAYAAGIDATTLELREGPDHKDKVLHNVPKAALLIALVDANTGFVVWFGYAEGNAQLQRPIEDIRTRIDYAVTKIFESFK